MRWLRLILLLLLVPLAACAVNRAIYPVDTAGPYRLNTGDVLRITVYGDPSLTTTYNVDDSGAVFFPLVGAIQVAGVTTDAAAARLSAALARGYMRNPNVAVEVVQYRPYYIQGEVTTSGKFPYVYGMTARAAVSTAGGFKDTADRSGVTIYRQRGGQMQKNTVTLDYPIQPGDTIVVGERWF